MKAARMSRAGMPPKFAEIEERTEPWMQFFLDWFFELDTERPAAFGARPIPRSRIREFADQLGFSTIETAHFAYIIRAMDNQYMSTSKESGNT